MDDENSLKAIIEKTILKIEQTYNKKELICGIPTSFKKFDYLTAGLQNGELMVIAGEPGLGKTAFCTNIAEHVSIELDKSVVFFSPEMSALNLATRMISSLSSVGMHKIRTGFVAQSDWPKITTAANHLYASQIHIDDSPAQTLKHITSYAKKLKNSKGLDVAIIDNLQLLLDDGSNENRVNELADITRGLKRLAKELDIPIIVTSKLSRKVHERPNKWPQLADLRDSGTIEYDADVVCFIYREEYYSPEKVEAQGLAKIFIAKQRNGPVGIVPLAFNKECMRFDNLAFDEPDFDTSAE